MGAAHHHIHIAPQLLDMHITLTHDCHVASHLITVLLMYRAGMDSNHGWWTEVCIRIRLYIYTAARCCCIYIIWIRYDAHHAQHINQPVTDVIAKHYHVKHDIMVGSYQHAADIQSYICRGHTSLTYCDASQHVNNFLTTFTCHHFAIANVTSVTSYTRVSYMTCQRTWTVITWTVIRLMMWTYERSNYYDVSDPSPLSDIIDALSIIGQSPFKSSQSSRYRWPVDQRCNFGRVVLTCQLRSTPR